MDINISLILFQVVNFGVVLAALTYLIYKPVLKVFEERAKRIEEGQKAADDALLARTKIDEMKKDAKTKVAAERSELLKQAKSEAANVKEQLLTEAKTAAQTEIEKERAAWQAEQAASMQSARTDMIAAVVAVSERLIGNNLDTKKQHALIETELDTLGKTI
ncbi:MAG: ATP synthase F0 subunit B [Pseudomonadales bacterium]|nr:ATP synthase F0 subunit B [Candidatus Woesebacteria bacterium]MCB9802075.1 ATP synthase F0 subunit B [Pseudomonadales bacterium]